MTTSSLSDQVFNHVMVDIETMSLSKHNALILSVGMVEFDPTSTVCGLKIGKQELIVPNVTGQLALGREVSASTQKWWADQKPEAREHWVNPQPRVGLLCMLTRIKLFCMNRECVWANGIQFDLVNLETLAAQIELGAELWHYRAPTDMRTFVRRTPQTRIQDIGPALDHIENQIEHHPVWDCISQAHQVWQHWQE